MLEIRHSHIGSVISNYTTCFSKEEKKKALPLLVLLIFAQKGKKKQQQQLYWLNLRTHGKSLTSELNKASVSFTTTHNVDENVLKIIKTSACHWVFGNRWIICVNLAPLAYQLYHKYWFYGFNLWEWFINCDQEKENVIRDQCDHVFISDSCLFQYFVFIVHKMNCFQQSTAHLLIGARNWCDFSEMNACP